MSPTQPLHTDSPHAERTPVAAPTTGRFTRTQEAFLSGAVSALAVTALGMMLFDADPQPEPAADRQAGGLLESEIAVLHPGPSQASAADLEPTAPAEDMAHSGDFTGWSQEEIRVLELTNEERSRYTCPALTPQPQLRAAARGHSERMAIVGEMAHDGIGDGDVTSRVDATGYQYAWVAENVAWGYETAEVVVEEWIKSPSHHTNLVNCDLLELGVSRVLASDGTPYWTQNFGQPQ